MSKKQKIVVVGGGYGGIKTALRLERHEEFDVTLISDRGTFRYYPTLYAAATGGKLAASSIQLEEIFRGKNVNLVIDSIKTLNRKGKYVKGEGKYAYDTLVLGLGVVTNFFGIKGLQEFSYGVKSIEEAARFRDHIHKQLVDDKKPDLHYVVIGGGPTGVELAGAIPHYVRHVMKAHGLKDHKLNVDLVEAAPSLMPRMPKFYSKAVAKRLRSLGVKLHLGETVLSETAESLQYSGGSLESKTVVWTAGVTNNPFFSKNKFAVNERGKVIVNDYLAAEEDIYVIGDNADTQFSGLAQTALVDGTFVAENLVRQAKDQPLKAYLPKQPAYATPIGPNWAAVIWGRIHAFGHLGWLLRSAADLRAFKDFEPITTASKHWFAEFGEEKTCLVCARHHF